MIVFSSDEQGVFQKNAIGAIVLFGSRAQGTARSESDYDFGILTKEKGVLHDPTRRKKIYDMLYDILSSHIKKLVNIDIVFLETAPYELQAHAMKHGKLLYENTPDIFANYRAGVMERYADFAPLRKTFHREILKSI